MICTNCSKVITTKEYNMARDEGWITDVGIACSEHCYEGMVRYLSNRDMNNGVTELAAEIIKKELKGSTSCEAGNCKHPECGGGG